MQLIDLLIKVGVPRETIDTYIESGFINKDENDNYYFVSGDLLITMLTKCIACKSEPKGFLIPEYIKDYDDELLVLYTHLITRNFKMAAEAAELIAKDLKSQPLELLIETCNKYKDTNEYILDEKFYDNEPETKEELKSLERKLLLDLELYDYVSAGEKMEILTEKYKEQHNHTSFPYILGELMRLINAMSADHTYVGNSNDEYFEGPSDYVFELLLDCDDIYRAKELLNVEIKVHPDSIEWNIYHILLNQIMILNTKNLEMAKKRFVINASCDTENNYTFPDTPYPGISIDEIKEIQAGKDTEAVLDEDYYGEYEDALFTEGNFQKAKEKLQMHQKQSVLNYSDEILDYLNDELDILIKNESLGVDMKSYNIALEFAFQYMEKEDYEKALNYTAKCHNLLEEKNPRILCMLGKIYYKMNDLKRSEYFYDQAFNYSISPSDLEDMIEVYSINKKYSKVINVLGRYDYYMTFQNPKVHYLGASAYLHLKKYDDSKFELDNCTDILEADENLPIEFADEREIVDDCENGIPRSFGIEDYIEYEVTDDEQTIGMYLDANIEQAERVLEKINTDKETYSSDLRYLLSVTKILFQANNYPKALELCERIDAVLNTDLLDSKDAKVYKKMLNNFKRM